MQSPTLQEQLHPQTRPGDLNPPLYTGFNAGIDWRETCWFLKHEEDELAGYLFTRDDEAREGSD
jgi:hypothetical protein